LDERALRAVHFSLLASGFWLLVEKNTHTKKKKEAQAQAQALLASR
jgi:hypothetical protein